MGAYGSSTYGTFYYGQSSEGIPKMAVTRVQRVVFTTSVNSPGTIVVTFAATQAGNTLLACIAVSGSPVAITPPANWQTVFASAATDPMIALYAYPNNPGGITSQTFTVTATNGGAAAMGYEFSGLGSTIPNEYLNTPTGSGTTIPALFNAPVTQLGELIFYGTAADNTTFTPTQTSEFTNDAAVTSTVATTNITLRCQNATNTNLNTPQVSSVTVGVSEAWKAIATRFLDSGGGIVYDNIQGNAGIYAPQFFQGMSGG